MISVYDLMVIRDANGNITGGEQVFNHLDTDGTRRHFAVDRINEFIRHNPNAVIPVDVPISEDHAAFTRIHRGVEQHRLIRITRDVIKKQPVLVAYFPHTQLTEECHLIVDGSHRYCAAFDYGMHTIPGNMVTPSLWEQFLIDIPEDVSRSILDKVENQHNVPMDSRIA